MLLNGTPSQSRSTTSTRPTLLPHSTRTCEPGLVLPGSGPSSPLSGLSASGTCSVGNKKKLALLHSFGAKHRVAIVVEVHGNRTKSRGISAAIGNDFNGTIRLVETRTPLQYRMQVVFSLFGKSRVSLGGFVMSSCRYQTESALSKLGPTTAVHCKVSQPLGFITSAFSPEPCWLSRKLFQIQSRCCLRSITQYCTSPNMLA